MILNRESGAFYSVDDGNVVDTLALMLGVHLSNRVSSHPDLSPNEGFC